MEKTTTATQALPGDAEGSSETFAELQSTYPPGNVPDSALPQGDHVESDDRVLRSDDEIDPYNPRVDADTQAQDQSRIAASTPETEPSADELDMANPASAASAYEDSVPSAENLASHPHDTIGDALGADLNRTEEPSIPHEIVSEGETALHVPPTDSDIIQATATVEETSPDSLESEPVPIDSIETAFTEPEDVFHESLHTHSVMELPFKSLVEENLVPVDVAEATHVPKIPIFDSDHAIEETQIDEAGTTGLIHNSVPLIAAFLYLFLFRRRRHNSKCCCCDSFFRTRPAARMTVTQPASSASNHDVFGLVNTVREIRRELEHFRCDQTTVDNELGATSKQILDSVNAALESPSGPPTARHLDPSLDSY
jgi:hypothetical protein